MGYVPSARPGARAPHVRLADGRSTLDLFGPGYTLLDLGGEGSERITEAAALRGVPLSLHKVDSPVVRESYERRLVLVRPDGHVAWRGDKAPADALALVDTVRGAGLPIAARRSDRALLLPRQADPSQDLTAGHSPPAAAGPTFGRARG